VTRDSQPTYGAVDLGSNSFHLLLVRVVDGRRETVDRLKERVALAEGLDDDRHLDEAAVQRGTDCLSRFAARLRDVPSERVRAVATSTLRVARNRDEVRPRFESVLGIPIEIIEGHEEARLVYVGAASVRPARGRRVVIDIGGGSTELGIGGEEVEDVSSMHMGCVNFTRGFFPGGGINEDRMRSAVFAARLELESERRRLAGDHALEVDEHVGTSGTIKAIARMAHAAQRIVDRSWLGSLRRRLVEAGEVDDLDIDGLKDKRRPVIAGGVAIVSAYFDVFQPPRLHACEGALRDGVVAELIDPVDETRIAGVRALARRHHLDTQQATRVARVAESLFDDVAAEWDLGRKERQLLLDAATLHEIGTVVGHRGHHKHGAYIVRHAPLPGVTRRRQEALAAVVLCHRRKLRHESFDGLPSHRARGALRVALLLRLAVRLCRRRSDPPRARLEVDGSAMRLEIAGDDALLAADLGAERERVARADYTLEVAPDVSEEAA